MNKVNAILYFKKFMHGVSKVRAKLGSFCIICSLGQVKFSLYKCIMAIQLSLGKYKILLFPHPSNGKIFLPSFLWVWDLKLPPLTLTCTLIEVLSQDMLAFK